MGARFVAASATYLRNTASPITAYPYTIAFWAFPRSTGTMDAFSLSDGAAVNWIELQTDGTNWIYDTQNGGTVTVAAFVNLSWQFVVVRGISATNRRMAILKSTGAITHGNSTASASVTPTNFFIGAFDTGQVPWDGEIAEFWYTKSDIQPGGLALNEDLMRKFAYCGPFSVPSIVGDIVEYRSLYSSQGSNNDKQDSVWWGGRGRQTWSNVNGVRVGLHPPLLPTYVRPDDVQSLAVI